MKSFTTKELVEIRESKQYITKERFVEYAMIQFGHTERESRELFEEFFKFPFVHLKSERPLEIASWVSSHLSVCWGIRMPYDKSDENKLRVKLFTELNGVFKEYELNLIKPEDAIKYASILQIENIKILAISKCVENDYSNGVTNYIYEGDAYHSHDDYWGDKKGNVYCIIDGEIKRLLYIKGKGYISNGKPNIDGESNYSTYAIFGRNPQYMGNINVDINFLKDE